MPRRSALVAMLAGWIALVSPAALPIHRDAPAFERRRAQSARVAAERWPELAGRVGPYGGIAHGDDARRMLDDGLTLAVIAGARTDVTAVLQAGGGRYIDTGPWSRVFEACRRQSASAPAQLRSDACVLAAAEQDRIAGEVSNDLVRVESDPALAGFWVLDDDPHGDVTAVLARIHTLVARSNERTGRHRPTICGLGGTLDHKRRASDRSFAPDRAAMTAALRNVSAAGCDLVAPYFYGIASADDASLVDWSLQDLLPSLMLALKAKGYARPIDIVLPVVHAFSFHRTGNPGYYVKPTANDIAAQMHAYCAAGAPALLFFTWQSQDADRSYVTDVDIRAGVQRGRADCLAEWGDATVRDPGPARRSDIHPESSR